jgi:hypothetical protein
MLLAALELVFIALMALFMTTQVFYPLVRRTQLFPILRKEAIIQNAIDKVNQKVVEKKLAEALSKKIEELK